MNIKQLTEAPFYGDVYIAKDGNRFGHYELMEHRSNLQFADDKITVLAITDYDNVLAAIKDKRRKEKRFRASGGKHRIFGLVDGGKDHGYEY